MVIRDPIPKFLYRNSQYRYNQHIGRLDVFLQVSVALLVFVVYSRIRVITECNFKDMKKAARTGMPHG